MRLAFLIGSSWRLLSTVTALTASARRWHSSAGSEVVKVNRAVKARRRSSLRCACDSASNAVFSSGLTGLPFSWLSMSARGRRFP